MSYDADSRFREQVGLLIRALRSDLESVHEIAVVQLSLFGPKAVPLMTSALSHAIGELESSRETTSSYMSDRERELSNPELAIVGLVRTLGIVKDQTAVPDIVKAFPRKEAVLALSKIGGQQATDALVKAIPSWYPRHESRFRESYSDRLEDENRELAEEAFSNLGREGLDSLSKAAKGGDNTTCLCACAVFSGVKDDSAVPLLVGMLNHDDGDVRTAAFNALTKLKADIPPDFVLRTLSTAFKGRYPRDMSIHVKLDELLDVAREDTLLEFYFNRDWGEKGIDEYDSVWSRHPREELLPYNRKLVEYYISKGGNRVMPKLLKYVESGTKGQKNIAAELIKKANDSELVKPPYESGRI